MRRILAGLCALAFLMFAPVSTQAQQPHSYQTFARVTEYTPCSAGSITANGDTVHVGSAASDYWPIGTVITGPWGWTVTVDDTGGGPPQGTYHWLDVWQPDCQAALDWGNQVVTVTIGAPNPPAPKPTSLRLKVHMVCKPKHLDHAPLAWGDALWTVPQMAYLFRVPHLGRERTYYRAAATVHWHRLEPYAKRCSFAKWWDRKYGGKQVVKILGRGVDS